MQDLCFNGLLTRILADLVVDDAVAQVLRVRFSESVAINAVGLQVVVDLVAHFDLVAFAEMDLLITRRNGIYFKVQRVELFDKAVLEYGIGVQTRGVERFATPFVVRRVEYADGHVLAVLGYHA